MGTHSICSSVDQNKERWWEEGEVADSVSFSRLGHACTEPIRILRDGVMKGTAPEAIPNYNSLIANFAFFPQNFEPWVNLTLLFQSPCCEKVREGRTNDWVDYGKKKKKSNKKNKQRFCKSTATQVIIFSLCARSRGQDEQQINPVKEKNRIDGSNRVINAGDGQRKACRADVAILYQVWQISDKAESPVSFPGALVFVATKIKAHLDQSSSSNSAHDNTLPSKNNNPIFYILLFVPLFSLLRLTSIQPLTG